MRLLFIGDIVGRYGREAVKSCLPEIRAKHAIDAVIANAENSLNGLGTSAKILTELTNAGVDLFTLGNHLWDHRSFINEVANISNVVVPANLPPEHPGLRFIKKEINGKTLGVISLLGTNTFKGPIEPALPFIQRYVPDVRSQCDELFLDFHSELSSEKIAIGWLLDGQCSAIIGTHTHIQTNDARRLPKGTLILSDAGMTGSMNGIIGRETQAGLQMMLTGLPAPKELAQGNIWIHGAILDFSQKTIETFQHFVN